MAIREGAWDCPSCGRIGNRGPEKHCAGCGYPRGNDVPFYLPADAPEVTDAGALEHAALGPDWTCDYCHGDNRSDASFCTNCGAGRDGSPPRPAMEYRRAPASGAEARQAAAPAPAAGVQAAVPPGGSDGGRDGTSSASRRDRKKSGCFKLGCLALVAVAIGLLILGWPQKAQLTASEFSWERSVDLEVRQTVEAEAWQEEVPSDARILSRRRAAYEETGPRTERVQVGTERVKVGEEDLGNGYFRDIYEDRPVYETREIDTPPRYGTLVRYQVERWSVEQTLTEQGEGRSPRWPRVPQGAARREGERKAVYRVRFVDGGGESFDYSTSDYRAWQAIQPGGRYLAKVSFGRVTEVSPFAAEDPG